MNNDYKFEGRITDISSIVFGQYYAISPKIIFLLKIDFFGNITINQFDIIKKDEDKLWGFLWNTEKNYRNYTSFPLHFETLDGVMIPFIDYISAEKYSIWYKLCKE